MLNLNSKVRPASQNDLGKEKSLQQPRSTGGSGLQPPAWSLGGLRHTWLCLASPNGARVLTWVPLQGLPSSAAGAMHNSLCARITYPSSTSPCALPVPSKMRHLVVLNVLFINRMSFSLLL